MVRAYSYTVHYDGCFMYQPLRYENGKTLDVTISKIGYDEMISYLECDIVTVISGLYFCLPGNELQSGLMKLDNDKDMDCLYDIGDSYGSLNIYLDHFGDDLSHYLVENEQPGNIDIPNQEGNMIAAIDANVNVGILRKDDNRDMEDEMYIEDEEKMEVDDSKIEKAGECEMEICDEGKLQKLEEIQFDADYEDAYDVDVEYEGDNSDVHSVDHIFEGEDELMEVRMGKQNVKEVDQSNPKELHNLDGMNKRDTSAMEATLQVEHDAFLEDLLKVLKGEDDENQENPFNALDQEEKFPIHDNDTHWRLKRPVVGERYESPKQLKECMTCYALANGFSIWYEVSCNKKIIARCGSRPPKISDPSKGKQKKATRYPKTKKGGQQDCIWRCYARWMRTEDSFQIISLNDEHTCSRNFKYGSLMNYKWIGTQFGQRIRMNPEIKLVEIAELVMKKYKCQVTPSQCSRARSWAINEYEKSMVEHYGLLRSYGDELLRSNPGSTVRLDVTVNPDEKTYFDRIYVCLYGLKEGWKRGCRRIIALDGCFLKGVCGGELLTAIGRDGNNHIFPVAWAVVSVENKDNWTWFIQLVGEDLEVEQGQGLTIMSDQHKGLVQAVKDVMPYAEHRQCARHIYENFRKVYSGVEFRNLFWRASKASYPQQFESVMNEIKNANRNAHTYLMEKQPKTWSRAFFEVNRGCDSVENGLSECFNFILVKVRHKPIITMLEAIRIILVERMNTIRLKSDIWFHDICPSIKKKLECAKNQQRYWRVLPGGGSMFEVRMGNDAFIVNEETKTCTCRLWQLSGIPCPHAIAAIYFINKIPEDYVPDWFRRSMFKQAYSHHLQPVLGMNQWTINEGNKPLPPKPKKMPGRPKKLRKKAIHEPFQHQGKVSRQGSVMTCHICFKVGHNRRSCTSSNKHQPPIKTAKKAGRPRNVSTDSQDKGKGLMKDLSKDKGKGVMKDLSKDKGKGVMKADINRPAVGGFMNDARRSYQHPSKDVSKTIPQDKKGKKKQKQMELPLKRRKSERILKMDKPPIKGPGSTSAQALNI